MPYQSRNPYSYVDISQGTIHNQLSSYLSKMSWLEGSQRAVNINSGGDCNGWAFLFAYYNSINKSAEFKDIRTYLSNWDGKFSSLTSDNLPASLKEKYSNGKQVFEQTINDLTWFSQIKTQKVSNYEILQQDRLKQYNIATDDKHEIKKVFDFLIYEQTNIHVQELPDMLRIAHQWNNAWLDVNVYSPAGGHALSVYLNENGSYTYYDCNEPAGEFTSFKPEEISEKIMKALGKNTEVKDFSLYQLHEKVLSTITEESSADNSTLNSVYNYIKKSFTFSEQVIKPIPTQPVLPAPEKTVAPLNVSYKVASKFIDMAIKSHDLDPIHTLLSNENSLSKKLINQYADKLVDTAINENHSELTKLILEKHYKLQDEIKTKGESTNNVLKISDFLSWDWANTVYKLTQGTFGETQSKSAKSSTITLGDCFGCEPSNITSDSGDTAYMTPTNIGLQLDNTIHLVATADIF